jgi:hypothetical protein
MAFSASVFAADVKFTGSYFAAGMYLDDTTFVKDATGKPSTAFYYQRLRVNMEFIATPALKLVTRFDAMERIWGGARSSAVAVNTLGETVYDAASYGTRAENQNIAFDWAYIWYASKVGLWTVGIIEDGAWGTKFGDNSQPEGKICWTMLKGPVIAGAQIVKLVDNSRSMTVGPAYGTKNDVDSDKYQAFFIYNFKGGAAGLLVYYVRNATFRSLAGFTADVYGGLPFFKAKFGPVALEGELHYQFGERDYEAAPDRDYDSWYAYLDGVADFGMFYAGGTFAWVSGDKLGLTADPGTDGKYQGNLNAGRDWNPMLMMFNYDLTYWLGAIPGYGATTMSGPMTNAYFVSGRLGVRPVADLDIQLIGAYAWAHKKPSTIANIKDDYGIEVDLTATYRITNNLSYMLGAGYLWTGDYYKAGGTAKVVDNYMLINKLTLTF